MSDTTAQSRGGASPPPTEKHAESTPNDEQAPKDETSAPQAFKPTFSFWMIIVSLGIAGLLPALETTIVTTALPTIIASLGGGGEYIWATSGYLLAM